MVALLAAVELVALLRVDLTSQQLRAYDARGRLVYQAPVSSGLPASPTPSGRFQVASKYADTALTGSDYRIPHVPDVLCLGGGCLRPDAVCLHPAPWQERAGERFGVSPASVSRWRERKREEGAPRPKSLGGDRRSGRIEAHHDAVLAALGRARDATIEEVRHALARQGLTFGYGTIQRFFARHGITRKKRPPMLRSRTVPTS